MMRSLWIAKTGLDAQQTQLDVISNNLANVSTSGFKRSRAVFEDLLYQTLRQPGANSSQQTNLPTGLQIGTGVRPVATERIFTQGNLQQTSNSLDVAINGQGFFQVQMPDGTTAYTRDGSFHLDNQGQIVTSTGYPIQPAITIPSNAQTMTIGNDGTVTVTQPGQATPHARSARCSSPTSSTRPASSAAARTCTPRRRRRAIPTTGTPGSNGLGTLPQGYVETSNVNVVEELVNMIQTQRAYEINSKAIQTSDQMLQRLAQL